MRILCNVAVEMLIYHVYALTIEMLVLKAEDYQAHVYISGMLTLVSIF